MLRIIPADHPYIWKCDQFLWNQILDLQMWGVVQFSYMLQITVAYDIQAPYEVSLK